MRLVQDFLAAEAAAFIIAALFHFGFLVPGYEHTKAGIAETVIGHVLAVGLVWTWIRPDSSRRVGLVVQSFALLGTLIGAFTILIGVGPRTLPDIFYYAGLLVLSAAGLLLTRQAQVARFR